MSSALRPALLTVIAAMGCTQSDPTQDDTDGSVPLSAPIPGVSITHVPTVDLSDSDTTTFVVQFTNLDESESSPLDLEFLSLGGSAAGTITQVFGTNPYAVVVSDLSVGTLGLVVGQGARQNIDGEPSPQAQSTALDIVDSPPEAPIVGAVQALTAQSDQFAATWTLEAHNDLLDLAWGFSASALVPPDVFTSVLTNTRSLQVTSDIAPECGTYFLWVRVTDHAGQESVGVSSQSFDVDTIAPEVAVALDDDALQMQTATLDWDIGDNCDRDLNTYITIGTAPGADDVYGGPLPADISEYSYQFRDGTDDISIDLTSGMEYFTSIEVADGSGNSTRQELPSWTLNNSSCLSLKTSNPAFEDGTYQIDPDRAGTAWQPYSVYCDMTTDGGGWTLAMRYDRRYATPEVYSMPVGSGRTAIHATDLEALATDTGRLASSLDIRPLIDAGATHFMHATLDDTDDDYQYVYFSEIYTVVKQNSDLLFDIDTWDTNSDEALAGMTTTWSQADATRWFESDFSEMVQTQTNNGTGRSYLVGGEGNAMLTNGAREGAIYTSHTNSPATGTGQPKVQWGFYGRDGTQPQYGGVCHVGVYCHPALQEDDCESAGHLSVLLVR